MKAEKKSKIENPKSKIKSEEEIKADEISRWVMWIIVAAGIIVRIPGLDYSFYGDEGFSLLRDSSRFLTDSEDRFRPIFFTLLYLWKQIGFSGEVGLRLLPLLFGVAQMPLAFLVGRELKNSVFGICLTVLVAASPILIEFSQELRMYSLITALALLQIYLLLRILKNPSRNLWIGFTATALIGVYTHLFYWLFLIGCALTLLRYRQSVKLQHSAIALGSVALLYLPNLPNLLVFSARRGGEYGFDVISAIPKLLAAFTVGFNYFSLPEQGMGRAIRWDDFSGNGWLAVLAVIAALPILWRVIWLHVNRKDTTTLWFFYEWFVIPAVIAALASFVTGKYFLQPKYLIFCAPFLLMFITEAYLSIRFNAGRRLTAALATAVFMIAMIHFWNPADYGRRENWKEAAAILSTTNPDDTAIILLPGHYRLLTYYAPELENRYVQVDPKIHPSSLKNRLGEITVGKQTIYYLRHDVAQNIEDPNDILPEAIDRIAERGGTAKFNPRFQLYHWTTR